MLRSIQRLIGGTLYMWALSGAAHAVVTPDIPNYDEDRRCFANVRTAATYEKITERVEVHPAFERQRQIPAVYEHQRLRVMVKDASFAYETRPAVYTTIFEDILVEPERQIEVDIPAKYETWTETVVVEPAKLIWKRGTGLYGRGTLDTAANITEGEAIATGEILCRVLIPAKKRSVHHTRMVSPPTTEVRTIPARYRTVARQVVKRPAYAQKVPVSAQYAAIPVSRQITPARYETEHIPATFRDVQRDVVKTPSRLLQAEVLCDELTTRAKVAEIQTALVDRGYMIRIDGIYGPETQGAMEAFQRDHGLSEGYMTVESVRALDVDIAPCVAVSCTASKPQTTITATQRALSTAGFYTAADGIHGPKTQAALERFQRSRGLQVGVLNAETMRALDIIALI